MIYTIYISKYFLYLFHSLQCTSPSSACSCPCPSFSPQAFLCHNRVCHPHTLSHYIPMPVHDLQLRNWETAKWLPGKPLERHLALPWAQRLLNPTPVPALRHNLKPPLCSLLPPNISVGSNILSQAITELGELENPGYEHFWAED